MTKSLLLLIGLIGWLPGSSFAQEILTLEKALEIAYKSNPTMIQSKSSLTQKELALVSQKARLKSQFSLNLTPISYNRSSSIYDYESTYSINRTMRSNGNFKIDQPLIWTGGSLSLSEEVSWQDASNQSRGGTNTSFTNTLRLSLNQPIFTYNKLKVELKEMELDLQNAKLDYAIAQLSIEKTVTNEFYSVYQNYKSLITQEESYKQADTTYRYTKLMVDQGTRPRIDLLQEEVNLAAAEIALANAQTSYENAKDQFKITLGLPLDRDFMVFPKIETETAPIKVDLDLAVKYALKQRMELRQKEINIQKGLFTLIKTKAADKFKGDINASIGLWGNSSNLKGTFQNPSDEQTISLGLSIPIFDWGARKANIRSQEIANEDQMINFEEDKKKIEVEIRQICRDIPKFRKEISIAKKRVENAEIVYKNFYNKYLLGTTSNFELQNKQKDLTDAKEAYTSAIINYQKALLDLKIQTLWDFQTNKSYLPVDLLK